MKKVTYARTAQKDLRKIGSRAAKLVVQKVEAYAADPASQANNVKALQSSEFKRLRVGDYRVIFDESLTVLTVERVRHRKEAYR